MTVLLRIGDVSRRLATFSYNLYKGDWIFTGIILSEMANPEFIAHYNEDVTVTDVLNSVTYFYKGGAVQTQ